VGGVSESSLIVYSGDHLAVTALSEGTTYALALSAPPAEDTGIGEDTGTGEDTGMGALAEGSGCAGCRVTPGGGWPLAWLAMPLLWGRRRR
jgi:MYXO-CTERM domain-containing protein